VSVVGVEVSLKQLQFNIFIDMGILQLKLYEMRLNLLNVHTGQYFQESCKICQIFMLENNLEFVLSN